MTGGLFFQVLTSAMEFPVLRTDTASSTERRIVPIAYARSSALEQSTIQFVAATGRRTTTSATFRRWRVGKTRPSRSYIGECAKKVNKCFYTKRNNCVHAFLSK